MNPEQSRRVDAALDQLRSLQRPYPHQPVLLDTLGSTARVAHLEETAATTEIPRPTRNSTKLGASRIVRKGRAPPAAGGCEAQQLTPLSAMKTNKRRRQVRTTPYAQRARVRYTRPLTESGY